MSRFVAYNSIKEFENASYSSFGSIMGPRNTLLTTSEAAVSIYPKMTANASAYAQPVQRYDISNLHSKYVPNHSTLKPSELPHPTITSLGISAFTSPCLFQEDLVALLATCDHQTILAWSAASIDNAFVDSHRLWYPFGPNPDVKIHSCFFPSFSQSFLIIVDTSGNVYTFFLPKKFFSSFNPAPLSILPQNPDTRVLACGNISTDLVAVMTNQGMTVYHISPSGDINTVTVLQNYNRLHSLQDAIRTIKDNTVAATTPARNTRSAKAKAQKTAVQTPAVVAASQPTLPYVISATATWTTPYFTPSKAQAENNQNTTNSTNQGPRPTTFDSVSISVLYSDGYLEIYTYLPPTCTFCLSYARIFSNAFVPPQSHIAYTSNQHLCLFSPTLPHDLTAGTHALIFDLSFFTVSAHHHWPETITPAQSITSVASFCLDHKRHLSILYIHAATGLFALTAVSELPSLAACVGSASRDARYWRSVPLVSSRAALLESTLVPSVAPSSTTPSQTLPSNARPYQHLVHETMDAIVQLTATIDVGFVTQNATDPALNATDSTTRNDSTKTPQQQQPQRADQDILLSMNAPLLSAIVPFASKPPIASLANQIEAIQPAIFTAKQFFGSSSFKTTKSSHSDIEDDQDDNITSNLDQSIISNWTTYLSHCDALERAALHRLLPHLAAFFPSSVTSSVTVETSPIVETKPKTRSSKRKTPSPETNDASDEFTLPIPSPLSSIQSSLAGSDILSTPAEHFLYHFYAYCSTWTPNSLESHPFRHRTTNETSPHYTTSTKNGVVSLFPHKCLLNELSADTPSSTDTEITPHNLVTSLIQDPCGWRALLASISVQTGVPLPTFLFQLLKPYLVGLPSYDYVANMLLSQQTTPQNTPALNTSTSRTTTTTTDISTTSPATLDDGFVASSGQEMCLHATDIQLAKPFSPFFTHLLFRECLRRLDTLPCRSDQFDRHNPNWLFVLPLHALIANCVLSSSLAVTCVRLALKHHLWSVVLAAVTATNVSHSEAFIDIITGLIDELCERSAQSKDDPIYRVLKLAAEDQIERIHPIVSYDQSNELGEQNDGVNTEQPPVPQLRFDLHNVLKSYSRAVNVREYAESHSSGENSSIQIASRPTPAAPSAAQKKSSKVDAAAAPSAKKRKTAVDKANEEFLSTRAIFDLNDVPILNAHVQYAEIPDSSTPASQTTPDVVQEEQPAAETAAPTRSRSKKETKAAAKKSATAAAATSTAMTDDDNDSKDESESSKSSDTSDPIYPNRSKFIIALEDKYESVFDFVSLVIPRPPLMPVLASLLQAPYTKPILQQQLRYLRRDYVFTLLHLLTVLLQAQLGQIPLPSWLEPPRVDHELITGTTTSSRSNSHIDIDCVVMWIQMLIDAHAKEIMLSPHLLASTEQHILNVFDVLYRVVLQYITVRPTLLDSVSGLAEQLSVLKNRGITKLTSVEPYSITIVKF